MKHARKLAGILLAMVMALALALPAFAATVTVTDDKGILNGHTFTAYQVFTGTYENNVLTNVNWGNGINSEAFLAALKADATIGSKFTDCTSAADVAEVLADFGNDSDVAKKVAELAYANKTATGTALTVGTTALADGYYLVVDTTENVGQGSAYNKALLQVAGDINITVKTDAPSVEKKVQENKKDLTASENNVYGNKYNDVADYNMGDAVPFKLIGTVPDMSKYDTYKYIFHDTMSNGLTLNADSIKVYVASDKAGTGKQEIDGWKKSVSEQTFTVSFTNLKTVANVSTGKYIIVEYTATLNQGAVVGLDGNPNEVYLEYSNKPDQSGKGDTNNTGRTPEDKVIVFTYELDVTKVDGDKTSTALKDAEFKLKNSEGKWAIVGTDGKITGWADAEENGSTLKSNDAGLFSVIGLDDGTYYLKETKAPTGYNKLDSEITLVVTATTVNNQTWNGTANTALTEIKVEVDENNPQAGDVTAGKVGIIVENFAGSTLPSTGGIGTTIFYVVGSILVLAAIVLLITKKRMSEDK